MEEIGKKEQKMSFHGGRKYGQGNYKNAYACGDFRQAENSALIV